MDMAILEIETDYLKEAEHKAKRDKWYLEDGFFESDYLSLSQLRG